jgi:hypothetical protein
MAKNKFDVVIIGNTLESLLLGTKLKSSGKRVLIVDQNVTASETIFEDHIHNFHISPAPESFTVVSQEVQKDILTFESAKWQPFLGFGNQPPQFLEALAPYLQTNKQRWNVSYSALIESLLIQLEGDIMFKAQISNFEVTNETISSITLNDSKLIPATTFVFANQLERLVDWFQPDHLGKKLFQKLAKTNFWTRLELNIKHDEQEVNIDKDHLLTGSTENAVPLFGGFYRNPEGFLCSQWISFIAAELTDDSEEAGNLLREMKRQLKRAYPHAFEGLVFEKIRVSPYSDANIQIDLNKDGSLGNLANAFVISGQISGLAGNDGKLTQVHVSGIKINDYLEKAQESEEAGA